MSSTLDWIWSRLHEDGTWAGLGVLLGSTATGLVPLSPTAAGVLTAIAGGCGALAIYIKQHK